MMRRRHIRTYRSRACRRGIVMMASLTLLSVIGDMVTPDARASLPTSERVFLTSIAAAPNGGFWLQRDGRADKVISSTYAIDGAPEFANVPEPGSIAAIPGQEGYWVVTETGSIFARGSAPQLCGGQLSNCSGFPKSPKQSQYISAVAATPDGQGLWAVGTDGKLWTAGTAPALGDVTKDKTTPTGIVGTPSGNGYYIVKADGGVFAFGDAVFYGSTGGKRPGNKDATGIALSLDRTGDVIGYWIVFEDGGVLTFGDAPFLGSSGGGGSNATGIAALPNGRSYAWVHSNGLIVMSRTIPTVVITNTYGNLGRVVDAPDASPGGQLVMAMPNGSTTQEWDLWPANDAGTEVELVNVNSLLCADLPNNDVEEDIAQYPCHGGNNQLWKISSDPAGQTRFEAVGHHGYWLGVATSFPRAPLDVSNFPPYFVFTYWALQLTAD
jgi:hypothetical protein